MRWIVLSLLASVRCSRRRPARRTTWTWRWCWSPTCRAASTTASSRWRRRATRPLSPATQVIDAIKGGPTGAIGVAYVEFASSFEVRTVMDWTVIRDKASAQAFADKLSAAPRSFWGRTAISAGSITGCSSGRERAECASRGVIDVCGDGTNNAGREVTEARDDAVKAGITINGLAIINDHPVSWTFAHVQPPGGLPNYYRENVTGGPGSFVLEVHDFHSFGEAMTRKLVDRDRRPGNTVGSRCAAMIAGLYESRGVNESRALPAAGISPGRQQDEGHMGLLIDGVWHEQDPDAAKAGTAGRFERPETAFRNWVTPDGRPGPTGHDGFAASAGRYHLYVSLACPWAHRTLIVRALKGLEQIVPISVTHWLMGEQGWTFAQGRG